MSSKYFCKTSIYITFFMTILSLEGCKKFVDVDQPENQVISKDAFRDSTTATSAVVGLYSRITQAANGYFGYGAFTLLTGLSGDELYRTSASSGYDEFYNNVISITNSYNRTNIWLYGYRYIYHVNACIEGLESSSTLSTSLKNQLTGEMKYMRALFYFYLTNIYGAVPLITSTDYQINEVKPRTSIDSVYQLIISDLTDAKKLLSFDYISSDRTRPNSYAASALLARVYLYRKNWELAVNEANIVINSGLYSLENVNNVFVSGSKEILFQIYPSSNVYNSAEAFLFLPTSVSVKPTYSLTNYVLNDFSDNDLRKSNWIGSNIISGITYYYATKYKVRTNTIKTEYDIVMREAELYLIRAEANYELGNADAAVSDINIIRQRAGIENYIFSDNNSLLIEIRKERKLEMFTEWGDRWFDLKRSGQINDILSSEKSDWNATDSLYPIPQAEIYTNPYLTQNPGY